MKLPCTLKLRHTGSDTKGGGVGPMVTDNLSCTLSTLQDQTLITEGGGVALCYDGYNQSAHTEVSMTLRSANGGGERNDACPKVAYGINPVMSGVMMETKPAEETAQTLRKSPGGENGIVQSLGFKYKQSEKSQKPFADCPALNPSVWMVAPSPVTAERRGIAHSSFGFVCMDVLELEWEKP